MLSPAMIAALAQLPPVPSTGVIFKGVVSTTTDEAVSTFTGVDIGVPHTKRLVILGLLFGTGGPYVGVTVNGIPAAAVVLTSSSAVVAAPVPNGTTASIVMTHSASVPNKAVCIYVAYPHSHQPIDVGTVAAAGVTNAVLADLKAMAGGFIVYVGGQLFQLSTFTTTWTGPDAVTEDADALIELASYTSGHIQVGALSSDLDDLTLAALLTGTKRLIAASWGPPPPGN